MIAFFRLPETRALHETSHGRDAIRRVLELVKAGGITGAQAALQAARKAGLKTMLGYMIESSVLITAAAHLAELADYLDIEGNLLISNDPFLGVSSDRGVISFVNSPEKFGLRVRART